MSSRSSSVLIADRHVGSSPYGGPLVSVDDVSVVGLSVVGGRWLVGGCLLACRLKSRAPIRHLFRGRGGGAAQLCERAVLQEADRSGGLAGGLRGLLGGEPIDYAEHQDLPLLVREVREQTGDIGGMAVGSQLRAPVGGCGGVGSGCDRRGSVSVRGLRESHRFARGVGCAARDGVDEGQEVLVLGLIAR